MDDSFKRRGINRVFKKNDIAAIGWSAVPDLTNKNKQQIKESIYQSYPNNSPAIIGGITGYFDKFVNVIKENDNILTYDPSSREYYLGTVSGKYYFQSQDNEYFPHRIAVKWKEKTISRDLLLQSTRNSLGATLTLFELYNEQKKEILDLFEGKNLNKDVIYEEDPTNEALLSNAKEALKDKINSLNPEEMEELVKEILIAMGYKAYRTPKGSDLGVDVFASKDGLGLEDPLIFVEVKHRKDKMDTKDLRAFLGGRKESDKCLYVSTGGFTKEAKYEAARAKTHIRLIDFDDLANLVIDNYENFSVEGKLLLPLKKVLIPFAMSELD